MDGFRIKPLNVEFLLRGQALGGLALVEDVRQKTVADGVENQPVLIAENLLLLLIGKARLLRLLGVRSGALANATSADKHLGLQQHLAFARLALHVVDSVFVLDVGIEAKNHGL